ncbi:nitroreductase family protein [Mycobacterium paragordonae]|uniref:nitroreductase family protein n=1 Tax=Mycobacterium paragordonae TaxID=1389713 RepID=UPI00105D3146|nr:hypothetical protein EUA05_32110 [Mycobacterium paragordonae]
MTGISAAVTSHSIWRPTTRAVRRRLNFERPVPLEVIKDCMRIALHAPSGSNRQGWHWIVITDPEQRARIAELYRAALD